MTSFAVTRGLTAWPLLLLTSNPLYHDLSRACARKHLCSHPDSILFRFTHAAEIKGCNAGGNHQQACHAWQGARLPRDKVKHTGTWRAAQSGTPQQK